MSTLNEFQAELDKAVVEGKLGEKLLARQVGVENNMLYLEIEDGDLGRVQAILDRAEAGDLKDVLLEKVQMVIRRLIKHWAKVTKK